MNKELARKIVRDTFENKFDKDNFHHFIKNLLNVFEEKTFIYRGNTIPTAYRAYIKTLERLGKYEDSEGNKIDILVVNLNKETSLEQARSMQRNFISWYLNGSRGDVLKDAALVAFVSPNEVDWRFSLVRMEYAIDNSQKSKVRIKKELTPAKRFSFLVGNNESSHTAQSRLAPIIEDDKNNPNLNQIEEAFNIEKVTQEFFEKYRELFLRVEGALGKQLKKDPLIEKDFKDKSISTSDFSKKLLGQIVFLYFLQKKGWFGVKRDDAWGTGPKDFLRRLFNGEVADYDNFFNDILEPLFYEALAIERPDNFYSRFNCNIPFLNGGLFDPLSNYDWVHTDIKLPNDLFSNNIITSEGDVGSGIIDIFDRYNFTVKEDEPLEKEVAVDPEMLGKVFENLLEVKDRKSKGTFYTPREIVHYMCQEGLSNYLAKELKDRVNKKDINILIKVGDTAIENDNVVAKIGKETATYFYKLPPSVISNAGDIDNLLADIRICDPAVGSGAFLVGMMAEIVKVRKILTNYLKGEERSLYSLKHHAIQYNLYGVDIDLGATEIAKLRLWLSLIVEERDINLIKPLPNLDYKVMQGNSLVDEFEGIKLFDEMILNTAVNDSTAQIETLKQNINNLQREYFDLFSKGELTGEKRKQIESNIRKCNENLKRLYKQNKSSFNSTSLFDHVSEAKIKADKLKLLQKEYFETSQKKQKDAIRNQIDSLTWDLIEDTVKEQGKESLLTNINKLRKSNTHPFFLWKLYFSEVFQDKRGFDIVIANPPYLEARNEKFSEQMKKEVQTGFKSRWPDYTDYIGKGADLMMYFFELGLYLINESGYLVFLTQNSWLDTNYGKKFQQFLINNSTMKLIADSDFKYFDSKNGPNINTIVTIFEGKTNKADEYFVFARFHQNYDSIPADYLDFSYENEDIAHILKIKNSDNLLSQFKWGILLSSNDDILNVLNKLNQSGLKVNECSEYRIDIGQGLNISKDYFIDKLTIDKYSFPKESIIPFITSADEASFACKSTNYFLIDRRKINSEQDRLLKNIGKKSFNPSDTGKKPAFLILPRGISKHYCTFNVCNAFSSSGVEVYDTQNRLPDSTKLNIWLFLNSTITWIYREVSGRKNLGGGLLKAEATDLAELPIVFDFNSDMRIRELYMRLEGRNVLPTLKELKTKEHREIDEIVFSYLGIPCSNIEMYQNYLIDILTKRALKSKN